MRIKFATASAVLLAVMTPAVHAQVTPRVYSPPLSDNAPRIDLWLDQISYRVGDRIAPHIVTEPGAYVTIVRVTSDGELKVLYPQRPREQKPFQSAQLVNDRVPYNSIDNRFQVYESQGFGFVFAVASFQRFDFSYFTSGGNWSISRLANDGRYGDPFEIVRRFVDRTLSASADFSMDYVSYEVYNNGARSRYASRYGYNSYDDYYDACLSAFGFQYPYCRSSYPGYYGYGPVIVSRPQTPSPTVPSGGNYTGKHVRPVTGDPLVHGAPGFPEPSTEGRLPPSNASEEAALAARRDRMVRQVTPRDRSISNVDARAIDREPRVYSPPERARIEPVQREPVERQPVMRPEPRIEQRVEPRVEQRAEPRPQPIMPARVEVRSEPPPAPMQRSEPAPRPAPAPVQKDNSL